MMDVLAETMALLRTKGQLYGRLELSAPFGLRFPGGKGICLIVTRGACNLDVDQHATVPLVGGDFVFLPSPTSYGLSDSPGRAMRSALEIITEEAFHRTRLLRHGGEGTPVSIVAGCFTFASPESAMLVKHLPPIIHLPGTGPHVTPWFQSTLQFIAAETTQELPGSTAIVDRLAEVLFVQAMRSRIRASYPDGTPSWLAALSDPRIGESIRLMHAEPERPWTLPDLAEHVAMSRSAFAARFKELTGETPLDHLTQWRMVRAAGMMRRQPPMKLSSIARKVGYESESSFGKVFRRVMGISPGKYRSTEQNRPRARAGRLHTAPETRKPVKADPT